MPSSQKRIRWTTSLFVDEDRRGNLSAEFQQWLARYASEDCHRESGRIVPNYSRTFFDYVALVAMLVPLVNILIVALAKIATSVSNRTGTARRMNAGEDGNRTFEHTFQGAKLFLDFVLMVVIGNSLFKLLEVLVEFMSAGALGPFPMESFLIWLGVLIGSVLAFIGAHRQMQDDGAWSSVKAWAIGTSAQEALLELRRDWLETPRPAVWPGALQAATAGRPKQAGWKNSWRAVGVLCVLSFLVVSALIWWLGYHPWVAAISGGAALALTLATISISLHDEYASGRVLLMRTQNRYAVLRDRESEEKGVALSDEKTVNPVLRCFKAIFRCG